MAENLFEEQMDVDLPARVPVGNDAQSDEILFDNSHEADSGHAKRYDSGTNVLVTDVKSERQQSAAGDACPTAHTQIGGPTLPDESSDAKDTLPDFTEEAITNVPEIQAKYDAYVAGFSDPAITDEVQLERAESLVKDLLEHYYPKNQTFSIQRADLSIMAKHGWRFWLYPSDTNNKPKGKAKSKTKGAAKKLPDFNTYTAQYHTIPPENITGFVVQSKLEYENDDGSTYSAYRPQTYIGIMIDNLATFDHWVPEHLQKTATKKHGPNIVSPPRADLLSYSLAVQGEITSGYGILLLGPRLEFYNYRQEAWTPRFPDLPVHEYPEEMPYEEPESFSRFEGEWMVDVRRAGLKDVDRLFRRVNERDVVGVDGHVRPGPRMEPA